MNQIKHFPLTLACVALIWYLCLFTPPKTQLDDVSNIDKVFHVVMYLGTMGLFWIEYWRSRRVFSTAWRKSALVVISVVIPILMSGIIELVQEYCTGGRRDGDWLDFLANSSGVLIAYIVGNTIIKKCLAK